MAKTNYSIKEAAKHLDMNYNTVLSLVQSGKLAGFKQGGRWQIRKEELDRFQQYGNAEPPASLTTGPDFDFLPLRDEEDL